VQLFQEEPVVGRETHRPFLLNLVDDIIWQAVQPPCTLLEAGTSDTAFNIRSE
jgi:hypothetical protein